MPVESASVDGGRTAGPAVRLDGVGFAAGRRGGEALTILSRIDLAVAEGEFLAIVGTSGCGKSTLLNIISGLAAPTSGTVTVGKSGSARRGPAKGVGYMFQVDALLPWRTVERNVGMGLEFAGVPAAERAGRVKAILAELGLTGFEQHYPSELSGGMRQRASLARVWVTDPDIILMDEPFGALDSQTKLLIQASFLSFWQKHRKTVVLVTHDLQEAVAMADRVIVMSARPGRIKSEIAIDLERPRSLEEVRRDPRFDDYWQSIWADLKGEAAQAMQGLRG